MKRTRVVVVWLCSGYVCLLCFSTAHAQFSADFQTNIISGVVSNWPGNYRVGETTKCDFLLIENGGALTDSVANIGV